MKRELRKTRHTPKLVNYIIERNGWVPRNFEEVDWEAHRIAMNRHSRQRTTLFKHMHNHLPVGHVVKRYSPIYSDKCPSCDVEDEGCSHLHVCPAESREKWRQDFVTSLKDKLTKTKTDPALTALMVTGVRKMLKQEALTKQQALNNPDFSDLAHIAESQHGIGWDQLLKGRLSVHWATAQHARMDTSDPKKNGTSWAAEVADFILTKWLELWKSRNDDRHGVDTVTSEQRSREQVNREVRLLYENHDGLVARDREFIFAKPLEDVLKMPVMALRVWVNSYRPLLDDEKDYSEDLVTG
jgi:hypothetical protein